MHYFFLQGSVDGITNLEDAIRFDSLEDAKKHPIIEGNRAVIIMTEHESLQYGYPYPYHLAHYYNPECGWQEFDEQEAFERANFQYSGIGKSLWDCEER